MYDEFPYPCFFYSIQYSDNSLLTRIGQDFAYSPKLSDFNKDILVRAINAYGDINTPEIFLSGLLNVTGPIYIAVDETIWFDVFNRNIFKKLIDTFDKYDLSNPLVKNAKYALVSLKNPHNIEYILEEVLNHYSENQILADSFIRDNLQIKYIKENIPYFIWNSLKKLISQFPLIDITELIFYMEDNEIMTKEFKDLFIEKILAVDIEALPKGRMSSFYLCYLTIDYPAALNIAKSLLLKHDVWHCGVLEDKKGWSMPNYIRLNVLKDTITWTDEEFYYISNNLRNNIQKYDSIHQSLHNDSFMRNVQVEYLSDVIKYIDGLSEERATTLQDIRERVEELLKERISYKNLIEGMLSEQSADADFAMDNVIQGIIAQGLSRYLDEFNFILDKAIMGDNQIINAVLHKIRIVIQNRPNDIISERMCSKLHTILAIYQENWNSYQEFKPAWSFNHLYVIAKFLKENGYEDSETIKYWLTDSFILRFIRL